MNKLITARAAALLFSMVFASTASADTFDTDRLVVTRTTVDAVALRAEIDRRADVTLGRDVLVIVSTQRSGEMTAISVTVDAPRLSQQDEIRLESVITAALRSPRVIESVRFFPTRAKH